jgi:hypothetical protein
MRAGHRHTGLGKSPGRAEGTILIALEPQDAHARHAARRDRLGKAGWMGAQILGNDDGARAMCLQRHQTKQIAHRIG